MLWFCLGLWFRFRCWLFSFLCFWRRTWLWFLIVKPCFECLFVCACSLGQFEILRLFGMRVDRFIAPKMHKVFLYRNDSTHILEVASRISFTSPCIRMLPQIVSEGPIIYNFSPEFAFFDDFLAFLTFRLVRFGGLDFSLFVHTSILINNKS